MPDAHALHDYAITQRSREETPIYYNLYVEFYLNRIVEILRKKPEIFEKAFKYYSNPSLYKFDFDPQDSRAKEIIHYPEIRFDHHINSLINLMIENENDLYPWMIIGVGVNNWS